MIKSCRYLCHQGGLRGDDPEITLTAFVLIALAEAKQAGISCSDPNVNLEVKKQCYLFPLFYLDITDTLSYLIILHQTLAFLTVSHVKDSGISKKSHSGQSQAAVHGGHRLIRDRSDAEDSELQPFNVPDESRRSR